VGEATIKRDGDFAAALDTLARIGGEKARKEILSRGSRVDRKAVKKIADVATGKGREKADPRKAKRLLQEALAGKGIRQAENEIKAEEIRAEPPPLPEGPFRVIVVDPPWSYDSRAADATHRAANPYPSMTLDQIKALKEDVLRVAHEDCILWLWTTNAHMRAALEVLDEWGFEHKTILTWVKRTPSIQEWERSHPERAG
jgi:hypothetical protein